MIKLKLPRRLSPFNAMLFKCVFVEAFLVSLVSLKFDSRVWLHSLFLGLFFGYLAFSQLAHSQERILLSKNKNLAFPHFFIRLLYFAVPIALTQFFPHFFNLIVLVLALLMFQYTYIILELIYNNEKRKKRS